MAYVFLQSPLTELTVSYLHVVAFVSYFRSRDKLVKISTPHLEPNSLQKPSVSCGYSPPSLPILAHPYPQPPLFFPPFPFSFPPPPPTPHVDLKISGSVVGW